MLEIAGLSVRYGQHVALEEAGLRVGQGEIVVILGANGAGKTTLLKAICGVCEGTVAGTVTLDGVDISGARPDRIVEEGLALVPEGRGVFADLKVEENLLLGAYPGRARDEERANLDEVYRLFPKLAERRRQVVRTMSGGEQQMVAIGRAMMSNPAILALDEPSLGLSPLLCKELFRALEAVRETGLGILLVEQNARASLAIADRGYLLETGRIVQESSAEALRTDPAVQRAYLGGAAAAAAGHAPRGAQAPASTPPAATPAAPAPKPVTPPAVAPAPAARPAAGPSPSDIAAAAMKGVERRSARPERPAVPPAPPPRSALEPPRSAPEPQRPAPPHPAATGPSTPASGPYAGIDTAALVARATTRSDRRQVARGSGRLPTKPAAAPAHVVPQGQAASRHTAPIPDLGAATEDRLRAVLTEIEQAARGAERRRDRQGR